MDPHVSRLVRPITEYSATQGSSGVSCGYWPGMDTSILLLALKQGLRSLEDYIREYLEIAYYSDLTDCVLIDLFCEGIDQLLKSQLTLDDLHSSLSDFMDYALMTVGSAFTVGVAGKCDTALTRVMADAPEHAHKMVATADLDRKMAATTTAHHVIAASHEQSQVTADLLESRHISAVHPESRHVTAVLPESRHVTADLPEPRHITADRHESSHISTDPPESLLVSAGHPESHHVTAGHPHSHHVTTNHPDSSPVTGNLHESSHASTDCHEASHVSADPPESLHVSADPPESLHVSADPPESLHVSADPPESLHVSADPPEPLHVSADPPEPFHVSADPPEPLHVSVELPESLHVSADLPESLHVSADLPESLHVSADHPESCCVQSVTPRYSRSVLRVPSLVSSVREAPLVSAHAAGIPKPTHTDPLAPELIPSSAALPMWGVTLWCIWAAYTTADWLEVAAPATTSPEVAAYAVEPSEVAVPAAGLPEAMVSAAVSSEVTPRDNFPELSVLAKEANTEFVASSVTTQKPAFEPLNLPVMSPETINASYVCRVNSITAIETIYELSFCPVSVNESID